MKTIPDTGKWKVMRKAFADFLRNEAQKATETELTLRTHPTNPESMKIAEYHQLLSAELKHLAGIVEKRDWP